mgnify:CR=1 FL=1
MKTIDGTEISKALVRKGFIGRKRGWCFEIYFEGRTFPNIISALFLTKKEAFSEMWRYINTDKLVTYGSAE